MKLKGGETFLSASDLSTHIACPHATWLNLQSANGNLKAPYFESPLLDALRLKGEAFEKNYIEELIQSAKAVVKIDTRDWDKAADDTKAAMVQGAAIIYQARLISGVWHGFADFLIRVEKPSLLGSWSYEVLDTKLSKETRTGAILQISLYTEMLEELQGVRPEFMHIKNPSGEFHYRTNDFAAYFRMSKNKLLQAIRETSETVYPNPVPHCDICNWWQHCNDRRRKDDHLSFIAGMGNRQIREVKDWKVSTLEEMANLHPSFAHQPKRGSVETYERIAHQAHLQHESRNLKKPIFETLPLVQDFGFYKLPASSPNDIFFDFEGDPFVGTSGLEYLFGWEDQNGYHELWATNEAEEKQALQTFMDHVTDMWGRDPSLHIYHFGAYEQSTLKRLVGKYATHEDELDKLLRAGVFVNLHTIFRHAVIAGVESYSLKALEQLHGYQREADLKTVGKHKQLYEGLLESGSIDDIPEESKIIVRDYNRDDCISTRYLRDWLEKERTALIQKGEIIPRPVAGEAEASEKINAHLQKIQPVFDALTENVPFEVGERNPEQQSKWLLANMLDWYRREKKSFWWEVYRLRELTDEELLDEKDALSGLIRLDKRETVKKSIVDYYLFPDQETTIRAGNEVSFKGEVIGDVHSIDLDARIVSVRKKKKFQELNPTHLICEDYINDDVKTEAIIRIAEWVVKNGMIAEGDYQASRNLLLRTLPHAEKSFVVSGDAQEDARLRTSLLNQGVLPIQGPPGTGKSHTASSIILSLIKSGKKIGITALSHKVITGLIKKVLALNKDAIRIRVVQKSGTDPIDPAEGWTIAEKNEEVLDCINKGIEIVAGTAFMWAKQEFFQTVDYLFVDEAGQLSLIDTVALSHAGKNLILLGDPQQLKQPLKGTHPEGTQVSALEHILQEEKTISQARGVFLDKTWRMHPAINELVSELFYESKLKPIDSTKQQHLAGSGRYDKPGIYFEPIEHYGNQNNSPEEINVVVGIVKRLINEKVYWREREGMRKRLTNKHIRIISPYNVQVSALKKALPGLDIGTVDKFQGQEAPVIIYSMATSTPEDAPRGMEFLYSLNRLNVAVSRAKAVFILVASPSLLDPVCRSPQQMQLANAVCRLREVAVG